MKVRIRVSLGVDVNIKKVESSAKGYVHNVLKIKLGRLVMV